MSFKLDRAKTLRKRRLKLYGNYFIPKDTLFLFFFVFASQMNPKVVFWTYLSCLGKNQKLNLCIFPKKRVYLLADIPNAVLEKSNWDSACTHNVIILVYCLKQDLLQNISTGSAI